MEALMARRARKRESGPWHEDKRFEVFITEDGARHSYLNDRIPRLRRYSARGGGEETDKPLRPLESAICSQCGHGYSHLMVQPSFLCDECKNEILREKERWLREQLDTNGREDWDDYRAGQSREKIARGSDTRGLRMVLDRDGKRVADMSARRG